jgi:hypothetical protein
MSSLWPREARLAMLASRDLKYIALARIEFGGVDVS